MALIVNGSVTNLGTEACSLSSAEVIAALPLVAAAAATPDCRDILLACEQGLLLYKHGDPSSALRLDCSHMGLRCEGGSTVMTLRNVSLCSLCTLAGGSSFVGSGSMFYSATTKEGVALDKSGGTLPTVWPGTASHGQPEVQPSPQQAALLLASGSVCTDPAALADLRAVWVDDTTAAIAGSIGSAASHSPSDVLGLRVRMTLGSWAHTSVGPVIWSHQPLAAFRLQCMGAAVVGPGNERRQLLGFCGHATNASMVTAGDGGAVQLEVAFIGVKLELCAGCILVGMGPHASMFRLVYSGSADLDTPSLTLHTPSCVYVLPGAASEPLEVLASTAPPPQHTSMCAPGACNTTAILDGLQLLRSVPGSNTSAMEVQNPTASPAHARAVFVSGTLVQTGPQPQCLHGMTVVIAFSRRVVNGTATYKASPDAFDVQCLGLGVAGLLSNQSDISRPCDDVLLVRMTPAGAELVFQDLQLCGPSCWLVGFGPAGSFAKIATKSGLPLDTSDMRLMTPGCAAS